jgi:hypothetical protein
MQSQSREPRSRLSLFLGILWRSIACGLGAGAVAGAAYGLLLAIPFVGVQSALLPRFVWSGFLFGVAGGAVAGVSSGAGIAILTTLKPSALWGGNDYIEAVRRTAALCTLAPGLVACALLGFVTLTAAGVFVYFIPTVLGALIANRLAPVAVRWSL